MLEYERIVDDCMGVIFGHSPLVFIKTGRGGTIYGRDNRYLKISGRINEQLGCTVVVSANVQGEEPCLEDELQTVKAELNEIDEIVYIGISNGALIGAQQGYKVPQIKHMLLINGPLMINWHRTQRGMEQFAGNDMHFVYGTKDPSYPYYGILEGINPKKCTREAVNGADHRFTGMDEEFTDIIVNYVESKL